MMELAYTAFIIIGFYYLLNMCVAAIGGNIYDILHFKNSKKKYRKASKYRPMITVLIPAYNEELVIERCLKSVAKNRYKNKEIIVINDASKDSTARLVRRFIKDNPKANIRLINRRNNKGKASGLTYAIKRHAKGELIMTLDGDAALATDALRKAVNYFADKSVSGLAANVRIIEDQTILNLLQRFEYMISYRTKKFYSMIGAELIIGGVGSVYRIEVIKQAGYYTDESWTEDICLSMTVGAGGTKVNKLIYAMDVYAYTESVESLPGLMKQRYRWKLGNLQNLLRLTKSYYKNRKYQNKSVLLYRIPISYVAEVLLVLEPLLIGFGIFLTIKSGNMVLFASSYLLLTMFSSYVLWTDEHLKLRQKFKLSLYAPTIYFLLYIMSFVQISAIFKCLANTDKIMSGEGGAWVPPVRSGHVIEGGA